MSKKYTSDDPTLNTDQDMRFLFLAVDWKTETLRSIGTCVNYTHARKRAADQGLTDAHPIGQWRAACGDADELQAIGAEEVAIVLFHPDTGELYEPYFLDKFVRTLDGKRQVGIRKFQR